MSIICVNHCLWLIKRSVDSLNILHGFSSRDESSRHESVRTIQRLFDSWYYGFGSPAVAGFLETVVKDTGGTTLDKSMHLSILEQIPDLLRISQTSPIADIRSATKGILLDLKIKKGFKIPQLSPFRPSYMIPLPQITHMKCITEEPIEGDAYHTTYILFREYWFNWGRLPNYISIMGYHPEYLECFMKLHDHLFRGDLPLPYPDRYYLAVMAAAEQRCIYLVILFAQQFLSSGGDTTWLQGIEHGPSKWRQLCNLNYNLANQPWKITSDDIYNLTHGGARDQSPSKETISLSELMHAVTILTQVHALSSFIFGCGVHPEIDHYDGLSCIDMSNGSSEENVPKNHNHGVNNGSLNMCNVQMCECLMERRVDSSVNGYDETPQLDENCNYSTNLLNVMNGKDVTWEEIDGDLLTKQFIDAIEANARLDAELVYDNGNVEKYTSNLINHPVITRFLQNSSQYGPINFHSQPFHVAEYSWQEEGFALADRLCTDLGTLLDEKFRNIYDLTYNTLNRLTNIDTSVYRHTIWNLVQSFYGICHEDFRYDRFDRLLNPFQRAYLKLCTVSSAKINFLKDFNYESTFPAHSTSEIVHVILMCMEARQQACLLYVLRAISRCQAWCT